MKEKSKREIMNSLVRICLAFLFASAGSASAQAQDFQQNVVPCRNAAGIMGYESIAGMNEDMMRELALLAEGKQPESSYRLVLCPNTVFDASNATLTPLLNNVMFLCGENGSRDNGCEFRGGTAQVAIEDSIIGAHKVNTVNFMGLTFTGFTGTSIGGGGSSNITVNLDMVEFASFDSMFVVQQQNPTTQPFNLNIQDSRIRDGNGGAAFSNAGGVLSLKNVEIIDTTLMAAVSTGSASGVTGMTMVSGTTVASSSIMDIFATMEGAQISATRITVMSMQDMTNIFDVTGMGSMALLDNVTIANNDLSSVSPPPRWVAVNVRDNAMASVTGMSISASTNIRHVISAQVSSMIDVENFVASDIIGGRQVSSGEPSGVFYADIGSDLMVSTAEVTNPTFFTSVLFAGGGSNVELARSCLIAPSETQAPVYISENATHSGSENFIDPAFSSSQCAEEGMRLAKEDPGQSCFEGTGVPCSITCMPFFDAERCLRTEILSEAPSAAPSSATPTELSLAPSSSPTSNVTLVPTLAPTPAASVNETLAPTAAASVNATFTPTAAASVNETLSPTAAASVNETLSPTAAASVNATIAPTPAASVNATIAPTPGNGTEAPTGAPTTALTHPPTQITNMPTSISPSPTATFTVAPSAATSESPTPAPSKSPTRSPTASPTRFPITARPPVMPTPSLPPQTAPPLVDDCIKFGKWVKRKYHIKGKGYQSYYVFDESACAIYRSDDWLMGHNQDPPAQYKAFGQADHGKGEKGSKRSGKGSGKCSDKGSDKSSGKGSSTDDHVPRKKRPPASIWTRETNKNLRRANLG